MCLLSFKVNYIFINPFPLRIFLYMCSSCGVLVNHRASNLECFAQTEKLFIRLGRMILFPGKLK